jgi:hypothetical protein
MDTQFDYQSLEAIIAGMFLDPQVRETCAAYIKPWMFVRKTYQYLVETLTSREMSGWKQDKRVLELHMKGKYPDLTPQDWLVIQHTIDEYSPIDDQDLSAVINTVSTFIKERLYQKGMDLKVRGHKQDAESYFCEAVTFQIVQNPFVNPNEEGILDKLRARDLPPGGKVIKSSLGIVNSVTLYEGYKSSDLILICAKAKAGKTLLALQESAAAAAQGFNVAHLFFGDYSEFSGICRMMSCITGAPISDVVVNYNEYKKRCERYLDYIRVAAFPAYSLDTPAVISQLKTLKKQFDFSFCAIDYDANIRSSEDSTMYQSGGSMYASFKGFAEMHSCTALIGSQIKPAYYKDEILDEGAPNESSRKVHFVDMMIGLGRNSDYRGVGTISLPVVRFGVSGEIARVRFDDAHSRIEDITPEEYDRLLQEAQGYTQEPSRDSVLNGVRFMDKDQGR